jgi:hypothetical protein
MSFRRKKSRLKDIEGEGVPRETLLGTLGINRWKVPEGYVEVESYPLMAPFSYCIIARNEQTSEHIFIVDELHMDVAERAVSEKLNDVLEKELEAPREGQNIVEAFKEQVPTRRRPHSYRHQESPILSSEGYLRLR